MPRKPIPEDAVVIKGTLDGVNIVLDNSKDIVKLSTKLEQKIKSNKTFFEGNQVFVTSKSKPLTKDEWDYIRSMLKLKYGVVAIPFGEIEQESTAPQEKQEYLFKSSSTGPRVVSHTLRAGQSIQHDGDLIILGDVNPGAEVTASGNVFVFGSLRGRVFAGAKGDKSCYITALDFDPVQLRIADRVAIQPQQILKREVRPQKAYIDGDTIVVVILR